MRADICAVEWDGSARVAVTIDIYVFVFLLNITGTKAPLLFRAFQHWEDGWCQFGQPYFEHRPDLVRLAERRVIDLWAMHEAKWGRSIFSQTACRLFYDPKQEVFDRRRDVDRLLAGVVSAIDMNTKHKRRTA